MSNLKELKIRINSTKSTKKITKAMQMVAASKLRKLQMQAEASRPYANKMEEMLGNLAGGVEQKLPLLHGNFHGEEKEKGHLFICATSNRGLCGGFNSSLIKEIRQEISYLKAENSKFFLLFIGSKGRDSLAREFTDRVMGEIDFTGKLEDLYKSAEDARDLIVDKIEQDEISTCSIIYNKFISPLVQEPQNQSLIPLKVEEKQITTADYAFEPSKEEILTKLLPSNLLVQLYKALLENAASEQGARMTAMDNATRNAQDMIDKLTLKFNRSRQAAITTELTEIISGAQAV